MTNKEAIINAIGVTGWQEGTVDKALIDFAIVPTDAYQAVNASTVNKAALQVLKAMLAVASMQEGGFSVSYSVEGIKARITDLEGVTGVINQPRIYNRSKLW